MHNDVNYKLTTIYIDLLITIWSLGPTTLICAVVIPLFHEELYQILCEVFLGVQIREDAQNKTTQAINPETYKTLSSADCFKKLQQTATNRHGIDWELFKWLRPQPPIHTNKRISHFLCYNICW